MRVAACIFLWMFCFATTSWGQTPKEACDTLKWNNGRSDTLWYINYNFEEKHPEVNFKLYIDNLALLKDKADSLRIDKGDSIFRYKVSDLTENSIVIPVSAGTFEITVFIFKDEGKTRNDSVRFFHARIFNNVLEAEIERISGGDGCMDGDTISTWQFILTKFENNPPMARYEWSARPKNDIGLMEEIEGQFVNLAEATSISTWYGDTINYKGTDTLVLKFRNSYGYKNVIKPEIKITIGDDDNDTGEPFITSTYSWSNNIRVYGRPKLCLSEEIKDGVIYSKYEKEDTICAFNPVEIFEFNDSYSGYSRFLDKHNYPLRSKFLGEFWYKDSVDQENWTPLADNTLEYVSTRNLAGGSGSTPFQFIHSGLYKVRLEIANECTPPGQWDTLQTGTLLVQSNDTSGIRFNKKRFCISDDAVDTLIFTDQTRRLNFEPPPIYTCDVKLIVNPDSIMTVGSDYCKLESNFIYKNGVKYDIGMVPNGLGSDSTQLILVFYKVGRYQLTFEKKIDGAECDPISKTVEIIVSAVPKSLGKDSLFTEEVKLAGNETRYGWSICGGHEYTLPSMSIDSNYTKVDSVLWIFSKGNELDTLKGLVQSDASYNFDHKSDTINYVVLKAMNECGWGVVDSLAFYTRIEPRFEIWRDSVQNNDTLCVEASYDYHLVGELPANMSYQAKFGGKVVVDGTDYNSGVAVVGTTPPIRKVVHNTKGQHIEGFYIFNNLDTHCALELKDTIHIVGLPDRIKLDYADSVAYCSSLGEIRAADLFPDGRNDSRTSYWEFKSGNNVIDNAKSLNPTFTLREGPAQLFITTSNGGGCDIKDTVWFKPQKLPELNVREDTVARCLGDTLECWTLVTPSTFEGIKYVVSCGDDFAVEGITAKLPLSEEIVGDRKIITLQYLLRNLNTNFDGNGCEVIDSVKVKIKRPKLDILRRDTLTVTGTVFSKYDFGRLKTPKGVDTLDLSVDPLVWSSVSPLKGSIVFKSGETDVLYGKEYQFHEDDKKLDEWKFVLSGKTFCGKAICDTLTVKIPKERIYPGHTTICSNSIHKLWGPDATHGEFIDTANIVWRLVKNTTGGTLSSAKGTSVTYSPNGANVDTVKIEIKAGNIYNPGSLTITDTVYLKINAAPQSTYKDTMLVNTPTFEVNKIHTTQGDVKNYGGLYWTATVGSWENPLGENARFSFNADSLRLSRNFSTEIKVEIGGNEGCKDIEDAIVLVYIAPLDLTMENIESCAGDSIRLKSFYSLLGVDRYTTQTWTQTAGNGRFEGDSLYIQGTNDPITKMKLEAKKEYQSYDEELVGSPTAASSQVGVTIYTRPIFNLSPESKIGTYTHDTLCALSNDFKYDWEWVDINRDDYKSKLVLVPDKGITGTAPNFVMDQNRSEAQFVVKVDLGMCKKWDNVRDSILLTRLPELSGSFDALTVCEGYPAVVGGFVANTTKYEWSAVGGTLDNVAISAPTFTLNDATNPSITLTLKPLKAACTERESIIHPVTVINLPVLNLKDTTICESLTTFTPVYDDEENVGSVRWTTLGSGSFSDATALFPVYNIDNADIASGSVTLQAVFTPNTPCHVASITKTIKITFQRIPKFTQLEPTPSVCQGTELDLTTIVSGENISTPSWEATRGSFVNPNTVGTTYKPGEITGSVTLTITSQGQYGCAAVSKNILVKVNTAVKPSFTFTEPHCVKNNIQFTNTSSTKDENGATWSWMVDGVLKSNQTFSYPYKEAVVGSHTVKLMVVYAGGCQRHCDTNIVINGLPNVQFKCDTVVGVNKIVDFINETGGTISDYRWKFAEGNLISDAGGIRQHQFTAHTAATPVTLFVTNENGCEDSLTRRIKVVAPPQVNFNVNGDRCTGVISSFENNSVGENITKYHWEFGDGTHSFDSVPTKSFRILDIDSTYVIKLRVTNAAGIDSLEKPFTVISGLSVGFEIMPDTAGCHQVEKKIRNTTWGTADKYTFDWGDGQSKEMEYKAVLPIYHTYTNDTETEIKTFHIKLKAKNVCHNDSVEHTVSIHPNTAKAVASLLREEECFGTDFVFLNQSQGMGGSDLMAWWYFEPGKSPIQENDITDSVRYSFDIPGRYDVILKIKDRCNSDSDTIPIRVKGNNKLEFDVDAGPHCSYRDVNMAMKPEYVDMFTNPVWEFTKPNGEQLPSKYGPSAVLRYGDAPSFSVADKVNIRLTAEFEGCDTKIYKTLDFYKSPTALITPVADISACAPIEVTFNSVSEGGDTYFWDFNNGSTSNTPELVKEKFDKHGVYNVLLRVESKVGCVDSAYKKITALRVPAPTFDIVGDTLICTENGKFELELKNTTEEADSNTYAWYVAGQNTPFSRDVKGAKFIHESGFEQLVLQLVAINRMNGICSFTAEKRIYSSPNVHLDIMKDVTTVCDGTPVTFIGQNDSTKVEYDLGDGTTSVETDKFNFQHTYTTPGIYKVVFRGIHTAGCSDVKYDSVIVYPLPTAEFDFVKDNKIFDAGLNLPEGFDPSGLPDVENGGVRFTNYSSVLPYDFSDQNLRYLWNFGDTVTDVAKDPIHRYANNGIYTVMLVTTTTFGCKDTVTDLVNISAVKGLFIPTAFAPGNPDEGVNRFEPKGIGLYSYKLQIYDTWGTCVFSTTKLNEGRPAEWWDGTFNGAPLPKGTYLWKAAATFIDGSVWNGDHGAKEGAVMLIR